MKEPEHNLEQKKAEAVLKERAQLWAKPSPIEIEDKRALEVIVFTIGLETYAVATRCIQEIYPLIHYTPLPCVPSYIIGILNIRGQICSILDLKKLFSLPDNQFTDVNKVVLLHSESMAFGLLVDNLLGMSIVHEQDLQTSLPTITGVREQYLKGITSEGIVVLDADKMLSDSALVVSEQVSL